MTDPVLRGMFSREALMAADWYRERLVRKQATDIALWQRHLKATGSEAARLKLETAQSPAYLDSLTGR